MFSRVALKYFFYKMSLLITCFSATNKRCIKLLLFNWSLILPSPTGCIVAAGQQHNKGLDIFLNSVNMAPTKHLINRR